MADIESHTITIDLDLNPSEAAKALLQYAETQLAILAGLRAIRELLKFEPFLSAAAVESGFTTVSEMRERLDARKAGGSAQAPAKSSSAADSPGLPGSAIDEQPPGQCRPADES